MASFGYLVLDDKGKEKKGSIEAKSLEQARTMLRGEGYTVLNLGEQSILQKDININIGGKIKARDHAVFCRQFASMLNAGVTVIDALGMMADATENKRLSDGLRVLQTDIRKGENMADSMRRQPKVFPSMLVQLVEAGEASGSLENSFLRMATQFEKDAKMKGIVKKAAIYPVIVLIVAIVVVIVMLTTVIPSYAETFAELGTELPWITQLLVNMSNGLQEYWWLLAIIVVVVVGGLKWYGTTDKGKHLYGKIAIKVPIFGKLTVKSSASMFARTMCTLVSAGVPMVDALEIVANSMSNVLYKDALMTTKQQVAEGIPMSTPLKQCGLFPAMVCHMVRIGEETGDIDGMLTHLADYYDEEVETTTQSVIAAIEPMIILVLAAIVVVIVAAIMSPMMAMYGAIDQM